MIARFRAWLGARKQLNEEIDYQLETVAQLRAFLNRQEATIAELQQSLSKEQLLNVGLASDLNEQARQVAAAKLRAEIAEAEAARLRADHAFVAAERCECGGDAELHWRRRAAASEAQAQRDRANAAGMADEIERLQLKVDEAERLLHLVQLERAGIAVIS